MITDKIFYYVEIEPSVHEALVRMYDRYVVMSMLTIGQPGPTSYPNFVNQLMLRGMLEYNKQLIELEQK